MTVFQNIRKGLIPARLSVDEVYALTEAGVVREGERFELIDGEMVPTAAANADWHEQMKSKLIRALVRSLPDDLMLHVESSVTLAPDTLVEPDLAVWPAGGHSQEVRGPDILLLIEVADSSLSYDLRVKAPLYALHGVREYWVVDAVRRTVRVHRNPEEGAYRDVEEYDEDIAIAPLLIEGVVIRLDTRETDHPAPPRSGPTYASYLALDDLLACQRPLSDTHDEMLFIVIHQASELWMKLCLHELVAARAAIAVDRLDTAFKMMARVARIQQQLIGSWEILATITPADYSAMRHKLGGSSGFQSHQYRAMEFLMGNKNPAMIGVFAGAPHLQAVLSEALHRPSIYDEALRALARAGLPVPEDRLSRDMTLPYQASPGVEACWRTVYAAPERYWDLYELAEKLVDLEYRFQLWRFGHLKTVERVIGFKRGTGGSAGVPYLAKVIDQVFFPELLTVRAVL